jgi:hypothetical protein
MTEETRRNRILCSGHRKSDFKKLKEGPVGGGEASRTVLGGSKKYHIIYSHSRQGRCIAWLEVSHGSQECAANLQTGHAGRLRYDNLMAQV